MHPLPTNDFTPFDNLTEFQEQFRASGLQTSFVADCFGISKKTILSWNNGRRSAPPWAGQWMLLLNGQLGNFKHEFKSKLPVDMSSNNR